MSNIDNKQENLWVFFLFLFLFLFPETGQDSQFSVRERLAHDMHGWTDWQIQHMQVS